MLDSQLGVLDSHSQDLGIKGTALLRACSQEQMLESPYWAIPHPRQVMESQSCQDTMN
jgi:hypothetical protein